MCSVLQQNLHLLLISFLLFYGKKVSKKPTTNEKLQFALTHTPTPQAVKLKFRAIRGRLRTVYVQTPKNHRIEWHVWKSKNDF